MVLLVLAIIWAAVLVPPMLRNRADGRPGDSIKQFHRHLRVLNGTEPTHLGRSAGAPVAAHVMAPINYRRPMANRADVRRRRTIERRRNILFSLVGTAAATLVLGVLSVPMMLALHVVVDVLLLAYVGLLARMRAIAAERDIKLRFLPQQANGYHEEDASAWGDISAAFATAGAQ